MRAARSCSTTVAPARTDEAPGAAAVEFINENATAPVPEWRAGHLTASEGGRCCQISLRPQVRDRGCCRGCSGRQAGSRLTHRQGDKRPVRAAPSSSCADVRGVGVCHADYLGNGNRGATRCSCGRDCYRCLLRCLRGGVWLIDRGMWLRSQQRHTGRAVGKI
jgi:hypothetical protein